MRIILSFLFFISTLNSFSQIQVFGILVPEITESSGLEYGNGQMYSHNDSGDSSVFFNIYPSSNAIPYYYPEIDHLDWEDIAMSNDNKTIYIGDTGSNNYFFEREFRTIYKIEFENGEPSDSVKTLVFDLEGYSETTNHFNFDCEAILSKDTNIYLFTKNYGSSGYSKIYRINNFDTLQTAVLLDSFLTSYRVTGADIYLDEIAICNFIQDK